MTAKVAHSGVAVVLTAIPVEYESAVAQLSDAQPRTAPGGSIYTIGLLPDSAWYVAVVQVAAGNVVAALQTLEAINDLEPDLMIFVGVAGGLKDVRLGDVVARL